jgi:hypothetical protein
MPHARPGGGTRSDRASAPGRSTPRKVPSCGPCRTLRHWSEIRGPPLASGMTRTAGRTAPSCKSVRYAWVMPTTLIQSCGWPGNPVISSMAGKRARA